MARVIAVLVWACLLGSAAAQDDHARRFFEQGIAARDAGRYVEAREHFEASYRLSPNSANAFQLAQTLHQLGLEREARDVLEVLLNGGLEPPLDPRARARVEHLLADVEAALGTIELHVSGPGGEVRLDGRFEGTIERNGSLTLRVNGGGHTLRVSGAGPPEERRVDIPRGGFQEIVLDRTGAVAPGSTGQGQSDPTTAPAVLPTESEPPSAARRTAWILGATAVAIVTAVALGVGLSAGRDDRDGLLRDEVFGVAMALRH